MEFPSADDKRKGLAFADDLARLAREAPDSESKARVYAAANFVRQRYGFTDKEKIEDVLHFICLGAATVDDLVRETGFPKEKISGIVTSLAEHKMIRVQTLKDGRQGPPRQLIRPIEPSDY
jgi:hypothetical protein